MTTRSKAALWYDDYYRKTATPLCPWNEFILPELAQALKPHHKFVELGCGQGHILRYLTESQILPPENIYGIDQSQTAIDFVSSQIPKAHLAVADLHTLNLPAGHFDFCCLMETIEHLTDPKPVLRHVNELLAPNGILYLSFPNYLYLPWLLVRILAEKLNKPNWINLQPVDKIYTVFSVTKMLRAAGFQLESSIGSMYCPPVPGPWVRRLEHPAMTRFLNRLGLWRISFHPIMKFRKIGPAVSQ
jgi:2-polyprenyl-3-methyl-5-hydroxy-6-metoxy-1,4-benzoquinol methylase